MRKVRRPWFRISDTDNVETLTKAFVVGGIITSDPRLSSTAETSRLRSRLRRLLGLERSRVIVWCYPAATDKMGIAFSASELAELFDEATAKREPLPGYGPWSAAVRLEVPVSVAGRATVGGVYGLSPDDIYAVLGIGAEEGFPTGFPITLSFAAAEPRGAFSFDWPIRVGSYMPEVEESWAARHGIAAIMDPDSASAMDLMLSDLPEKSSEIAAISIFTVSDYVTTAIGNSQWRELAEMGGVIVPGFEPTGLTPWFDELTLALSHDRRFDVAVFEAWNNARRRPGVVPFGLPMLVAWHGAFDHARLSNLVAPTIQSLRSRPKDFHLFIPKEIAARLDVPPTVSAPRLATRLERSTRVVDANLALFRDHAGSRMLSVIRPQVYGFEPSPPRVGASQNLSEQRDPHPQAKVNVGSTAGQPVKSDSSEKRQINAWLEDGEPPLERGRTYHLGINVGKLRQRALASAKLPNVEWGDNESLEILIVVSGYGLSVEPRQQTLSLPRHGDTEPVFFAITPVQRRSLLLRITLYLARELTLLEEFEIPIKVQDAIRAA